MSIKHIWQKEIVCEACGGNKYIECCSTDGSDCERILCPQCGGKGTVVDERKEMILAAGILTIVLAAIFVICH